MTGNLVVIEVRGKRESHCEAPAESAPNPKPFGTFRLLLHLGSAVALGVQLSVHCVSFE